uniref:Coiled-coil domain-containing protein 112-like n=1 Tax=Phallusia mammillata TaxID=59560 RepID=A0A6F9D922_9ASCI|nr:coiled-coil domain-containing protein 112-like [Phallusia mammillata]
MLHDADGAMQEWKSNTDRAQRAKFLRDWSQIKFQAKTLNRELSTQMRLKNGESKKMLAELEKIENCVNEEIKTERLRIDQHLCNMKDKVTKFHRQLTDVKSNPEYVSRLRNAMEDIETTITTFKEQQRKMFEDLLTEETGLERDIEIIQNRLETMAHSSDVHTIASKPHLYKASNSSNLPPEVKTFEKYLAQFGPQGGWDDYDHGTFLKLRNKFKAKSSFITAAVEGIPGRREEDILDHEKWYKKFLELQTEKKKAISEWKLKKEQETKDCAINATSEEELSRQEQLKKEREKIEEVERERRKQDLEAWKALKAQQTLEEAERKKKEDLNKKRMKEKQELTMKQVREEARMRLKEKKEEKERDKWRREAEQEEIRSARSEQALKEIGKFQMRDNQFLESKKKEKSRKEELERLKEERLQKVKREVQVNAQADRNRLYRPTDAWIQRNKQRESDQGTQGPVINMPHRAVPTWRQGI